MPVADAAAIEDVPVAEPVLRVENLCCGFHTEDGYIRVVDGVSFECEAGKTLGLVGESGCGKTVSALAVMGLLPQPAGVVEEGRILFRGEDLAATSHDTMRVVRGQQIGMIFQEPMTALNPVHRVGKQLLEALRLTNPALTRTISRRVRSNCSSRSGSRTPCGGSGNIRISSQAACASAS